MSKVEKTYNSYKLASAARRLYENQHYNAHIKSTHTLVDKNGDNLGSYGTKKEAMAAKKGTPKGSTIIASAYTVEAKKKKQLSEKQKANVERLKSPENKEKAKLARAQSRFNRGLNTW